MQKILFYTTDLTKEKKIKDLCKRLSISTRKLKSTDANIAIGNLAGIGIANTMNHTKSPKEFVMPEVIIFSGLADEMLDTFLAEYKKDNIEAVPLKAVITKHNINWTLYMLIIELIRERNSYLKI